MDHFFILGQKFIKCLGWFFGKLKTPKSHSEINWPLINLQIGEDQSSYIPTALQPYCKSYLSYALFQELLTTRFVLEMRNKIGYSWKVLPEMEEKIIDVTNRRTLVKRDYPHFKNTSGQSINDVTSLAWLFNSFLPHI